MACLLVLFALISPRLAIIVMALTSDYLSRSMDGNLVPLIGFFLLPWTTFAYAGLWASGLEVSGFEWFLVGLAFMFDLGSWFGGNAARD